MTRAMLRRRLRALAHDERGFTILETVIAIMVMFASLVALAYTATVGFRSIAYARERVTFNGVADRIMEEIRGQAYTKIQTGLLTSDLAGDANIINCGGAPTVYRFESCSTGEKIVSSGGVAVTPWINPHSGTVAAAAITNNVGYTWSTYITNNDPATQPYRVTVIVQWASAAYPNKTNNLVRVQSLFASPSGCVNSATHPFGAPCQPFFYGLAQVPAGEAHDHRHRAGAHVQHRLPPDDRDRVEPPERAGDPQQCDVRGIARVDHRRARDADRRWGRERCASRRL